MPVHPAPARKDDRIIIHFDYDCFYAAVFEARNPSLKSLPLAVQQKQIIVTCNYEARRRGLHKLQLIRDAKRICPDVIIELGEDISQFRDASKELYGFISEFSWNRKIERLGFDEVWVDVTDMVDYNIDVLNHNDLQHSFFQISRDDPTRGFPYDATVLAGHAYPKHTISNAGDMASDTLTHRLRLGSHLAQYLRHELEQQKGYTSTVGIATSKLLSKLVGNLNKPKGQTTLMPPLDSLDGLVSNVRAFMDNHEIGKIPGIGFKLALKLRELVLKRPAEFDAGLVYGQTKEKVTVADLRGVPDLDPEMLEKLLAGPGSPHGIGYKIWCLIHGVDDSEVHAARAVPRQISIEDSYIRLDTMPEVLAELTALARSLLSRMRIDLLGDEDGLDDGKYMNNDLGQSERVTPSVQNKKWLAHPKTLRLTTRPRQPLQPDGTRVRSFKRISHSAPLPNYVFGLQDSIEVLAERLVKETLLSMFRKLHPEKAGWNLSLVNLAVTNMAETASESKTADGRDIGNMFKRQEDILRDFKVIDTNDEADNDSEAMQNSEESGPEQELPAADVGKPHKPVVLLSQEGDEEAGWEYDEADSEDQELCGFCGMLMPAFAMAAHQRFHLQTAEPNTDHKNQNV